jgi:hypothetical protein
MITKVVMFNKYANMNAFFFASPKKIPGIINLNPGYFSGIAMNSKVYKTTQVCWGCLSCIIIIF